jgi:hypothetical protein
VTTTEDHPFWNATDQQWQPAATLDTGDQLVTATGTLLTIDGLETTTADTGIAYNLTVADLHTCHVQIGGEAALVHNSCGGKSVADTPKLKKGSIRRAPLPPGSPSWDDILDMPIRDVEQAARRTSPATELF